METQWSNKEKKALNFTGSRTAPRCKRGDVGYAFTTPPELNNKTWPQCQVLLFKALTV